MILKDLVEKNFSKSVKTYDKYAIVQKHMANELYNYLPQKPYKNILEIGSGTGLLTKYLMDIDNKESIDICDISKEMLLKVEKDFGSDIDNYIYGDIEEIKLSKKYDLIISNATFQWFNNIDKTLEKLLNSLSEDGILIFSTFGKETYKELTSAFKKEGEFNYSQNFLTSTFFTSYTHMVKEEMYVEEYKNLLTFLKSIKGVGATSAIKEKKHLTKGVLERVEEIYKRENDGRIKVTNHLIYVMINKKEFSERV